MSEIEETASLLVYHPSYSSPDADLVLLSSDDVAFRVHLFILNIASSYSLFEISSHKKEMDDAPVPMGEASDVMEAILGIVYPANDKDLPVIGSYDFAWRLISAAEKYEIKRVISVVRFQILADPALRDQALELYALTCRLKWDEEAKSASTGTLAIDLRSPDIVGTLKKLNVEDLLRLQRLHWSRIHAVHEAMSTKMYSTNVPKSVMHWARIRNPIGKTIACRHSNEPHLDFKAWTTLRYNVLIEMQRACAGNVFRHSHFWDQDDFADLWTSKCQSCGEITVNKEATIKEFLRVLDDLPNTI